jgi:hypothetical protein
LLTVVLKKRCSAGETADRNILGLFTIDMIIICICRSKWPEVGSLAGQLMLLNNDGEAAPWKRSPY